MNCKNGKSSAKARSATTPMRTLEEVRRKMRGGPASGVFTDGSARPNPGPGGWGVVWVRDNEVVEQWHGHEADTTNNRMEFTALIEAYTRLPPNNPLTIYTDSQLCVNTVTQWAPNWRENGWKKKGGAIKNLDLVKKLMKLTEDRPELTLTWLRGHAGALWNEYADALATAWARECL